MAGDFFSNCKQLSFQKKTLPSINRVELLGGVAADPLIKQTVRGSEFASFNLFTNVDRRTPDGQIMTNVEVHNVIAFGGLAKYIRNNIQRGINFYFFF